jgi:hypothetical protein
MRIRTQLIAGLAALSASPAFAVSIGFEGVAADDSSVFLSGTIYSESGFSIDLSDNLARIAGKDYVTAPSGHGSATLSWCGSYDDIYGSVNCLGDSASLSHEDSLFSLHSFDIGSGYAQSGAEPNVIITGQLAGGGTLTETIALASWSGMQSVILSGAWTNLESVSFSTDVINYHCCSASFDGVIDNIVVTAVPVPAAAWLFGSALAGLGWIRRKQAA